MVQGMKTVSTHLLVLHCFTVGSYIYILLTFPHQVLQKLIRFYLQKKDKVLLFSLSTKVRAVWIDIVRLPQSHQ